MKSNVILQSTDRVLFGVTIKQGTKDAFLSLTDLQKAYETARWQYGWSEHRISDIMQTRSFKERIFYILENQGVIKTGLTAFMEMVDREGITKVLKGLGVYKTTGARDTKTTYSNPYIWILLAMELNPMIYAKVIVWLTDSLIFDRIDAGSEYLPMNAAISSIIKIPNYPEYAKLINKKVFGQHITGMRNLANSKELKAVAEIEKDIIKAIKNEWIKTEADLLKYLKSE